MHDVYNKDTLIEGRTQCISVRRKKKKYIIKEEYHYYYNGYSIGRIEGRLWDYDYYYLTDSVIHYRDSVSFFKNGSVFYKTHQRNVFCYNEKKWECFYCDSVCEDDLIYKIQGGIRFLKQPQ